MDRYSRSTDYAIKALKYNTGIQLVAKAYYGKWGSVDLNEHYIEHIGPEMPLGSIPRWSGVLECSEALRRPYMPFRAHYRIWRDDYDKYMAAATKSEIVAIAQYIDGWMEHSADLGYPLPIIDCEAGGYYLLSDAVPWAPQIGSYAIRKLMDAVVQVRRLDTTRRYV